jgi:4-amino-4-deoxy-L-arabinose transferase-like glycosyltransferase
VGNFQNCHSQGRWIGAIILIGAVLRLWGIQFGLPSSYHPDEHNLTFHAMEALGNNLHPGWFEYPSLMMYLLAGLYAIYFGILSLLGHVSSGSEFYQLYLENSTGFTLPGRVLVAGFGVATLPLIHRLGRWGYGRTTGFFSLVFLSVAFLHVRDSHFITVDVPLTFFCTLAVMWALLGYGKDPKYLGAAAVAAGLAAGAKYTGALALLPIWMSAALIPGKKIKWKAGQVVSTGAVSVVVFLVSTPYSVLDFPAFWNDLSYQFFTTQSAEPIYGGSTISSWPAYLTGELRWGLGLPLLLLGLLGVGQALRKRHRTDWILLSFLLPYYLFIGSFDRHWGRWILPIVPVLLVLAARLWSEEVVLRLQNKKYAYNDLIPIATVLLIVIPLYSSVRSDYLLTRADTRTLARQFLENDEELKNLPTLFTAFSADNRYYEKTLEDYLNGEKAPNGRYVENSILKDRPAFRQGQRHRPLMPPLEEILFAEVPEEKQIRLFVTSSFYRGAAEQERVLAAYPTLRTYQAFYDTLQERGELVKIFSPVFSKDKSTGFHVENIYAPTVDLSFLDRPGPRIEIYRVAPEAGL